MVVLFSISTKQQEFPFSLISISNDDCSSLHQSLPFPHCLRFFHIVSHISIYYSFSCLHQLIRDVIIRDNTIVTDWGFHVCILFVQMWYFFRSQCIQASLNRFNITKWPVFWLSNREHQREGQVGSSDESHALRHGARKFFLRKFFLIWDRPRSQKKMKKLPFALFMILLIMMW